MSSTTAGSADSHFIWKVSVNDGTDYNKVAGLIKIDMPSTEKVTDDTTRTDDTSPRNEVVNFTEGDSLEFELVLDPSNETHIALEKAKDSSSIIKSQIHFVDTRVKGFEFACQISKFSYDPSDVKKKIRVNGKLTLQGSITRITSNPTG